jgi:hypothetical protein
MRSMEYCILQVNGAGERWQAFRRPKVGISLFRGE